MLRDPLSSAWKRWRPLHDKQAVALVPLMPGHMYTHAHEAHTARMNDSKLVVMVMWRCLRRSRSKARGVVCICPIVLHSQPAATNTTTTTPPDPSTQVAPLPPFLEMQPLPAVSPINS